VQTLQSRAAIVQVRGRAARQHRRPVLVLARQNRPTHLRWLKLGSLRNHPQMLVNTAPRHARARERHTGPWSPFWPDWPGGSCNRGGDVSRGDADRSFFNAWLKLHFQLKFSSKSRCSIPIPSAQQVLTR
jgi:hypothetical protein